MSRTDVTSRICSLSALVLHCVQPMGTCASTDGEPGLQSKGLQLPAQVSGVRTLPYRHSVLRTVSGASFISNTSDVIDRLEASLT